MNLKHQRAVKALIKHNDKFLVLRKEGFIGGDFDLPGGRKKKDEDDESALKREVAEEVKLAINIIKLLNIWEMDLPTKGFHLSGKTYLCSSDSDETKLSDEHYEYRWLSKQEILSENIPFWLRQAIQNI
ncbi:MAG: NUDIX domain-containing protein [bacterium]|nr:NUDIX domain-containing protein [bacterium]